MRVIGYLSVNETAKYLGISTRTVRRMDYAGKIPMPAKFGRCKRWNREELAAWAMNGAPSRVQWEVIWPDLQAKAKPLAPRGRKRVQ